ncbi:MAG: hypothetical protein MMC23_006215 [Stictis urceolatum]|nr:hypothetical protein [Stictis urceolata]
MKDDLLLDRPSNQAILLDAGLDAEFTDPDPPSSTHRDNELAPETSVSANGSSTPLLCSLPGSLSHTCEGMPTEVEIILHKLAYPPAVVKLVAQYRITTREDLLMRMRAEVQKIKWELGYHKQPFEESEMGSKIPKPWQRSPRHKDMPPRAAISLIERSRKQRPELRPRKESFDNMDPGLLQTWGNDAQEMEDSMEAFFRNEESLPISVVGQADARSCAEPDTKELAEHNKAGSLDLQDTREFPAVDISDTSMEPSFEKPFTEGLAFQELSTKEPPGAESATKDRSASSTPDNSPPRPLRTRTAPELSLHQKFLWDISNIHDTDSMVTDDNDFCLRKNDFDRLVGQRKRLPAMNVRPRLRKSTSMHA